MDYRRTPPTAVTLRDPAACGHSWVLGLVKRVRVQTPPLVLACPAAFGNGMVPLCFASQQRSSHGAPFIEWLNRLCAELYAQTAQKMPDLTIEVEASLMASAFSTACFDRDGSPRDDILACAGCEVQMILEVSGVTVINSVARVKLRVIECHEVGGEPLCLFV
jgi:hypothetical protein